MSVNDILLLNLLIVTVKTHHGHILTGNLDIINHPKLRSLLCKGPKFREKERINWEMVQNCINTGIDECAVYWSNYEKVDIKVLSDWRTNLKKLVKDKAAHIVKIKKIRGFGNPICLKTLNRTDVKSYLRDLHRDFVLVPTDKAQNNISIVCKKFYLDSLLKEVSYSVDGKQSDLKNNMQSLQ